MASAKTMAVAPAPQPDPGSFRNPSGHVFRLGGRLLRSINAGAAAEYEFVRESGLLDELRRRNFLTEAWESDLATLPVETVRGRKPVYLVEHPPLDFISYPYEWTFGALKDAALRHIEIHRFCLERGITLSDASAYNMQFRSGRPIHIDLLSFRRYREGEIWTGHNQFCRQFLNPLLLASELGIPFQSWYRGSIEGIEVRDLARLLPWRKRYLDFRNLYHVTLQDRLERRAGTAASAKATKPFSKRNFLAMLEDLALWIDDLQPARASRGVWADYAGNNSYAEATAEAKRRFVAEFTARVRPALLFDLGCNTGVYSELALEAGARSVVGFEGDSVAADALHAHTRASGRSLLPLVVDLASPTPAQGWAGRERKTLEQRGPASAVLALAVIHHLAIGRNVPLVEVISWIMSLAPQGVIEFVPKSDPMIRRLQHRTLGTFDDYNEETFRAAIARHGRVVEEKLLPESGRLLVAYAR